VPLIAHLRRVAKRRASARGRRAAWVGSSSTRGGTPPFLVPYFAAKAAMDALAVSYSTELARWGIESTSMVPGAFTKGTNHFAHSGEPADADVAAEYENGPYAGVTEQALKGLTSLEPSDADPVQVAREIINVVNLPFGNGRSACTSIRPRTALKWSRWWRTGCAARCTSQSACRICFRRRSTANSKVSRRTIRVEFCIGERARRQILRDRQLLPRVRRDAITVFVSGPDTIVAHQTLPPLLAGRKAPSHE
jgi:hypothetical protein